MFAYLPLLLAAATLVPATAFGGETDPAGLEYFETKVRPLLADNCYKCHGPKKQKSGLRLDSAAAILLGGDSGPAVRTDDPSKSALLIGVRYTDELFQMPPKKKLADEEIAILEEWIAMGAPLPAVSPDDVPLGPKNFDLEERSKHWSFQPLKKSAPPRATGSAIDAFIDARLQQEGLSRVRPAARSTWLRRASFDLTGLPPAWKDVQAFLDDDGPAAYETAIDQLLASPHFGERWARHWLDLVRYAETIGQYDFPFPNAHHYRDYVIRAFNADLPYDRFVTEQVAGDLLDEPRIDPDTGLNESVLGTAFWYLGDSRHSPVDIRSDETDRIANQIDVFSKTFLGLTVACARCHDHMFDAIPTTDYYALSGFALSSAYRQVRFETMEKNGAIARRLARIDSEVAPDVSRVVGEPLFESLDGLSADLLAAAEVIRRGPMAPPEVLEIPAGPDFLFEDFESRSYDDWTAAGGAFGSGPVHVDELPEYLVDLGEHGKRLVNSHVDPEPARQAALVAAAESAGAEETGDIDSFKDANRNPRKKEMRKYQSFELEGLREQIKQRDALTGSLTSKPFRIAHGYLHFLVGGGSSPEQTCVQLLIDDQVVRTASGRNVFRLQHGVFDLTGLRGQLARLRIVDEREWGWGSIGVDQFVFSDRSGMEVIEQSDSASRRTLWQIDDVARDRRMSRHRLARLVDWLESARSTPADPLHSFALDAFGEGLPEPAGSERLPADARVLVDFSDPESSGWQQNGFSFGSQPVRPGDIDLGSTPDQPIVRVHDRAAAAADPTWDILTTAPDNDSDPNAVYWEQAGRTLYSDSFTLESGRLFHLVRGRGHVYAPVDSHRAIYGPLHGALVLDLSDDETPPGWRWVEQDLSRYAGHRCRIEYSPYIPPAEEGLASDFAVALVIESTEPPPPIDTGQAALLEQLSRAESLEQRAEICEEWFQAAARAFAAGGLAEHPEGPALARVVDRLLERGDLFPVAADESRMKLAPLLVRRVRELAQVERVSRTAPAVIDCASVDENVLARGNPRTPKELVPRRFLAAADGFDPLPIERGSGRLGLARRICAPENPFLSRVIVNRVWHHLFGRGLVASVDDFGVMGQEPTHPELLDHLALELIDDGWSLKRLIRRIMLSETYRMASIPDATAKEKDPANRLLHAFPVRRLTGEAVRDTLLAVSGRLDRTLFGPSVPVFLTPFMDGRGRPEVSGPLDGDGRRSLYIEVRRNFLTPFFLAFDFPIPQTTMGRRTVSNVPAQALTLLNDPLVLEQAGFWARRTLAAAADLPRHEVVDWLYRQAFSRRPTATEMESALSFLDSQANRHADREDAELLIWTDLCHVLFNVKELIFVE